MKIDTSWKIVERITLINWCLVGHDEKTPYARRMGKKSNKEIVQNGEEALAEIARGRHSSRKHALQTRSKEAVWVSKAKMLNEEIVISTDGGHAIQCRGKFILGHDEEAQHQRAGQEGHRNRRHDQDCEA